MPIYIFRCPVCHFTVETLQSYRTMSPTCPVFDNPCWGTEMERLISAPAIRTEDKPEVRTGRSKEGFRITTTDMRRRKERE